MKERNIILNGMMILVAVASPLHATPLNLVVSECYVRVDLVQILEPGEWGTVAFRFTRRYLHALTYLFHMNVEKIRS